MKQMQSWMIETAMVTVITYKMKRLVPAKIKIKAMVMFFYEIDGVRVDDLELPRGWRDLKRHYTYDPSMPSE